jgi:hypothetical protein
VPRASIKYLDSFAAQLLAYARDGLAEAKRRKAKKLRIWWAGMPFMARVYNLTRYIDDQYLEGHPGGSEGYDQLAVPKFPIAEIGKLVARSNVEFFRNEEGTLITEKRKGWDAAFDCGPDIEAGAWTRLAIDARIAAVDKQLQKERGRVKVEVVGDDGTYYREAAVHLNSIAELRAERGYTVGAPVVAKYLAVLTDDVAPAWTKAAAKLK